ncbi:MAG TPA: ubiquitin-like protein [Rhizomicrobium sp.]|jgi:hypothetical protein|nr:ubiquitin-like protein [Rhizomicrobium sp.]
MQWKFAGASALTLMLAASPAWAEHLMVKTLTGKTIDVEIGLDKTVGDAKAIVMDKEGIPVAQQRLIYGGKQLEDTATLSSYGLTDGATVHLVLRLRGG